MDRDFCLLSARDGYLLDRMLRDWPAPPEEWRRLLKRKIGTAARLPLDVRVPLDLAVIDARVSFRCARGWSETRTLCLPQVYTPGSAFLPITSFYGLALIGLREGQSIAFDRPEGRRDWIALEKVHFQPSAPEAGRRDDKVPVSPGVRLIVGAPRGSGRFLPANENGSGSGPGPSAA